jgi:purine-nucleoside phosphorylase
MLGFTGTWKGVPVTVMGSGMGGPSAGIYSYELYNSYGAENIIRIGTAGGLQDTIGIGAVVFALTASTDSNYAYQYRLPGTYSPCADFSLLEKAVASARKNSVDFHAGPVFSSDLFSSYNALGSEESWKPWARMGCLAQDMETYALYCTASWLGKKALSILTHTDSCVTGEGLPTESRMSALHPMFVVALDTVL